MTILDKEFINQFAAESGATAYTTPLRAVRGWSFTDEQLARFVELLTEPVAELTIPDTNGLDIRSYMETAQKFGLYPANTNHGIMELIGFAIEFAKRGSEYEREACAKQIQACNTAITDQLADELRAREIKGKLITTK